MAKKKSIKVSVLISEEHKGNLTEVASGLKDKGFVVKESLGAIGVLTGTVPATALASLAAVPGVLSVEEERTDYHTQT